MLPKSTQFFSLWFWYIQKESLGCDSIFFAPYLTANKLESNLFYKLNITLMGLCLPSLDINVEFTKQLCGKSIHLKSLMYFFQRIGINAAFHITQAVVFITWTHRCKKYLSYIPDTHLSVYGVLLNWYNILWYQK